MTNSRTIWNNRLIDWAKIENLPDDTQAELDWKLDDVNAWVWIFIDKTDPNEPIIIKTWAQPTATKTVSFIVTADFASWEVINITTWIGDTGWTSNVTVWDTWAITSIWVDANAFNIDASLVVTDNKTIVLKWIEVIWDSATTFHFTRDLAIWEWFIISDGETSGWLWAITIQGLVNMWDSDLQWNVDIWGTLDVTWVSNLTETNVTELTITWSITKAWSTVWTVTNYVDDSGWSSIINLPTAVWLLNQSFAYIRTDTSLNTTTFIPDGVEAINNNASFLIWKGETLTIISNNSNWFII